MAKRIARHATPAGYPVTEEEVDACWRWVNNFMGYWRVCDAQPCRRKHGCAGNGEACFNRFWRLTPEAPKVYLRTVLRARDAGRSIPESIQDAEAEVVRAAEHIARADAATDARLAAKAQAASQDRPATTLPVEPPGTPR
jgi:hypothetical protein